MCNLYAMTAAQAAIREIAKAMTDQTGNLPTLPAIFPDQSAPVVRQGEEGEVTADLYGFLTTEANETVGAIHPKAMPVILTEPEEWETWLTAPFEWARALQRPLPDDALTIVAEGERRDAEGAE